MRYSKPPRPIVPVMAISCEPPWTLYRLEFIDMQGWEQSEARYQQALEQLLDAIELAKQGKQALRGFVLKLAPRRLSRRLPVRQAPELHRSRVAVCRDRALARHHRRAHAADHRRSRRGQVGPRRRARASQPGRPGGRLSLLPGAPAAHAQRREFVRNIAAMLASQIPPTSRRSSAAACRRCCRTPRATRRARLPTA